MKSKIVEEREGAENTKVSAKFLVIVAVIIILIAGYCVLNKYGYIDSKYSWQTLKTQVLGQSLTDDQKVLAQLKTILLLPEGVTPTMAIVTNADILKQQQPGFFADVKNGDRLIIYPNLAIIYDYKANKIIKIGPVQNAQVAPPSTSTKPK